MKKLIAFLHALLFLASAQVQAHHSFAIYDIDNRIERTGVLTKFVFSQPHIQLELLVENEDGSTETWVIESMNPSRWDRMGKPRDLAWVGETVTLLGWPARNGSDEMLLSAITTERGNTVIIDKVRQPGARTNVSEVSVKRE